MPILAVAGSLVGGEVLNQGKSLVGKGLSAIGNGIKSLFGGGGGKVLNKTKENSDSIMSMARRISASLSAANPEDFAAARRPPTLHPSSRDAAKKSLTVSPSTSVKIQEKENKMSGLSNFVNGFTSGLSGSVSFGESKKLVNVVFWIIAGVVAILIIRPFGILSGSRKRRR